MTEEHTAALRWQVELDQLLTGLHRGDVPTEHRARFVLAMVAKEASRETVIDVFEAIAEQWERRLEEKI